MESRYVPYTETYKIRKWTFFHQTRSRTNYRIEVRERRSKQNDAKITQFLRLKKFYNSYLKKRKS